MSGLRTLSKVCEEYELSLMSIQMATKAVSVFMGREGRPYNLNIYVWGQVVNICDSTTYLGKLI